MGRPLLGPDRGCARSAQSLHRHRFPPLAVRYQSISGLGGGSLGSWRSHARGEQARSSADSLRVGDKLAAGADPLPSDEDVHTLIDRMLHDEVGDVASKLHTGRSRNDQVATATRLWSMDACVKLDAAVRGLQQVMLDQAETLEDALMPAYTHLQRAQPVSAAHWILSHFWPLERDRARICVRFPRRRRIAAWAPAPLRDARFRFRGCCSRAALASAPSPRTASMPSATAISSPSCCSPLRMIGDTSLPARRRSDHLRIE